MSDEKYFIYFLLGINILITIYSYIKKKKLLIYTVGSLFSIVSVFFFAESIKNYKMECTNTNAIEMINVLSQYKKEYGFYPKSLNALEDSKNLPKNRTGLLPEDFEYVYVKEEEYYMLKFYTYRGEVRTYTSNHNTWFTDD